MTKAVPSTATAHDRRPSPLRTSASSLDGAPAVSSAGRPPYGACSALWMLAAMIRSGFEERELVERDPPLDREKLLARRALREGAIRQMICCKRNSTGSATALRHYGRGPLLPQRSVLRPTGPTRLRDRAGPQDGRRGSADDLVRAARLDADHRASGRLAGGLQATRRASDRVDRDRPQHRLDRAAGVQAPLEYRTVGFAA